MKKLYPLLLSISFIILAACGQSESDQINKFYQDGPPPQNVTNNTPTPMPNFDQTAMPQKGEQIAVMETNLGTIKIRLFPTLAPKTVENFTGLIDKGYYNGLTFHRVIPGFMIQGGDPNGDGTGGESIWGKPFEDEINPDLSYIRGAVAMANSGPNTNGSQFFIVQTDSNANLGRDYSIFGQAFDGLDVVDKIANVPRDDMDKPLDKVVMQKVTLEKY